MDNGHVKHYVVRITPRAECRCVVKSCPANRGTDGCTCEYCYLGIDCGHPRYRQEWHDRGGVHLHLADADAEPQTLTARVSAAARTGQRVTPEAARERLEQLGLGLEVS